MMRILSRYFAVAILVLMVAPHSAFAIDFAAYAQGPLDVYDYCTKTPIVSSSSPLVVKTVDYVVGLRINGDMVVDCSYTPAGASTWVTWCFEKKSGDPLCTDYEADSAEGEKIMESVALAKKNPRSQGSAAVASSSITNVTNVTNITTTNNTTNTTNNTTNNYGGYGYAPQYYAPAPASDIQKIIAGIAVGLSAFNLGRSLSNWGSGSSFTPSTANEQRIWELGYLNTSRSPNSVIGGGGSGCSGAGSWQDVNGELKPVFSGSSAGCSTGSGLGGFGGGGSGITAGSWQDVNGEMKPVFPGASGSNSGSGSTGGLDPFDAQSRASVSGNAEVLPWERNLNSAANNTRQDPNMFCQGADCNNSFGGENPNYYNGPTGSTFGPDIPGDMGGGSGASVPSGGVSPFNPRGEQIANSGDSGSDTLLGGSGGDTLGGAGDSESWWPDFGSWSFPSFW